MENTQANKPTSKEHYNALKDRKEELERIIEEKEAELRRIKIEEAKLTGIVPDDLTEEERSTLPKQMATSYTLQYLVDSDLFKSMQSDNTALPNYAETDKELKRLTRAFEVQCNIVKAEYKIYKGHYTSKKIRKQRKKNYKNSEKKLKELERQVEKRKDALGISLCAQRHSRFYSDVIDKDAYQWEVLASKSLTMPHKIKNNVLSVVDENRITHHGPPNMAARHSTAAPYKLEPILKARQKISSNTIYNKKSNASDSLSTASLMDGSSFLSLYSRDSSSRISSCSVSSDEDRCISCPATELILRKQNEAFRNDARQKRVSQHLDLALPEKAIREKTKETIDNLNLDITNQVIFKPSTHYPEPALASLPFSASVHSARDFYTNSLPVELTAERNEPITTYSGSYGKHQYTSDQICKQQYQQKLAYTQQNTTRTNRSPSPHVQAANTKYPLPYMRVNSLPHGLHSSKSPSHEQINNAIQPRYDRTHSQTHLNPYTNNSMERQPQSYGGTYTQPNGIVNTGVPITRIHTTPNNITTLDYSKPTHYPQGTSPKLKHREKRSYPQQDMRSAAQYQPYTRTHNPGNSKYTNPSVPPVCQIQITPPEPQQYCAVLNRYTNPYNHQATLPSSSEDRITPLNHLNLNSHDPLAYSASLPMSQPGETSPGVKYKIDYWEYHAAVNNSKPNIPTSRSMEKISRQSYPPTETNRQALNKSSVVSSRSFRGTYTFDNTTPSDEGTPV